MRLSIDPKSPFYNSATPYIPNVYLDGVRMSNALEFCTVMGYVWKYKEDLECDIHGNFIVERRKGNKVTFDLGDRLEIVGGVLRFVEE